MKTELWMGLQSCPESAPEGKIVQRESGARSGLKWLPLHCLKHQVTGGLEAEFVKTQDQVIVVRIAPIDIEQVAHASAPLLVHLVDITHGTLAIQMHLPLHHRADAIVQRSNQ